MNKIVVIDLDECLCSVNTFRFWLFFSFLVLFVSLRWVSLVKFNIFIISRLLGRTDRVCMKRNILSVTETLPDLSIRLFCKMLSIFTNKKVMLEAQKYKDTQMPLVLCTAAPVCYAGIYARQFGFTKVLATETVQDSGWKENIREEKLRSVERCFGEDVSLECVITDHHDDLALLKKAKKCILVNPSTKTLGIIGSQVEFDVI